MLYSIDGGSSRLLVQVQVFSSVSIYIFCLTMPLFSQNFLSINEQFVFCLFYPDQNFDSFFVPYIFFQIGLFRNFKKGEFQKFPPRHRCVIQSSLKGDTYLSYLNEMATSSVFIQTSSISAISASLNSMVCAIPGIPHDS